MPRALLATSAVAALAVLLASSTPAQAHARLVRSTPRDGQLLGSAPAGVELWFNETLDDEFNSIEVVSANAPAQDAPNLASGPALVDKQDRTHLSAPLQRLTAGKYLVRWRVLSRDGHSARGRAEFVIRADGPGAY